jgi:hypothetical protein
MRWFELGRIVNFSVERIGEIISLEAVGCVSGGIVKDEESAVASLGAEFGFEISAAAAPRHKSMARTAGRHAITIKRAICRSV